MTKEMVKEKAQRERSERVTLIKNIIRDTVSEHWAAAADDQSYQDLAQEISDALRQDMRDRRARERGKA